MTVASGGPGRPTAAALAAAILVAAGACGGAADSEPTAEAVATSVPPTAAGAAAERPVPLDRDAAVVAPGSLTWSPTGEWLAYATADGRLWLHGGRRPQPLGVDLGGPGRAVLRWSPDGSALLAGGAWNTAGETHTALWLVPVSRGGVGEARAVVPPSQVLRTAAGSTGAVASADWDPTGDAFVFAYRGEAWRGGAGETPAARLTRLGEEPVFRGDGAPFDAVSEVAWSPDGGTVALALSCGCPTPWGGVAVVAATGGRVRLLVDGGLDVAWSPDGRIVFTNSLAEWSPTATVDRYAVDPATSEVQNLTHSNPDWDPLVQGGGGPAAPVQSGRLAWGPRGQYLHEVFALPAPDAPLPGRGYVVRSADGAVLESHPGGGDTWFVAAGWVGDEVGHIEAAPGPSPLLYRRAVIGRRPVLDLGQRATAAAWSADGRRLAVIRRGPDGADEVVFEALGGG